jgi:hypothetical protein
VGGHRALFFVAAASLAACGGFLGFGGDDDDDGAPQPPPDSSAIDGNTASGDEGGSAVDASDDVAIDAIVSGDAALDVIDTTPLDAAIGSGLLVVAKFETGIQGGDGADTAENMEQVKTGAIDGKSAHTLAARPARLAWTFTPQGHLFVVFSLRILAMPNGAGAELARLTGAGASVSILVGANGLVVLRSGMSNAASANKMQVGAVYRIGFEVESAQSIARAGIDGNGGAPVLVQTVPWSPPGSMDQLQIVTNDTAFDYVIDDVIVSTKGP